MGIKINKEIFEAKLTINTNCLLRCAYCFVDKNNELNPKMTLGVAKKAIDFFLNSKGRNKIIKIYGGEPLLNFSLVEKITPYTYKKAKEKKVKVTLSLCTNAVLLKRRHIVFFKKNKFQLAISFDGKKTTHDKFRRFPDGKGTFSEVEKKIRYLFNIIDRKNAAANMAVTPSEASKMFENFQQVINTGFDTLNIEPIYGFQRWNKHKQEQFLNGVKSITKFIFKEIPKNNFIFLTTINRELKYETLSKLNSGICLFHQFPEVYPDGRIGFSSFLLNLPKRTQDKYITGNVLEGWIKPRYIDCIYSRKNKKCHACLENYFDKEDKSLSSRAVEIRNKVSIDLANLIKNKAKNEAKFKNYIREAKKHICF